jgi:endonuclease/exonuclease/phosphatase family metal-dependent hydrolase
MQRFYFSFTVIIFSALLWASCAGQKESTQEDALLLNEKKPQTSTFTLLSINTVHALQNDGDIKKLARWIKSTGASVIAVQEIERATESKPGFDAVTALAKSLDMRFQFGKARYYKGWDSGNALFSPYPIQQSSVYSLPVGKGKVRRSLTYGVIDLGLKQLGFGSTELDDESLSERLKQVSEIYTISQETSSFPMIVTGDFGEAADGKTAEKMSEKYLAANTVGETTKAIAQHVYVPASDKFKVVSAQKMKYSGFDAPAILTTIEIIQ